MNEASKVLNKDEKVIWQGQPQHKPFVVSPIPGVLSGIIFGSLWLWIFLSMLFSATSSGSPDKTPYFFLIPFTVVGALILAGSLWRFIYAFLVYKHTWYVVTDKRVIFQRGLIGRDFDFADYDKVESATVEVGVIDKIFGANSGSIAIYANRLVAVSRGSGSGSSVATRNVPFVLAHIPDPYNIFSLFKKVSFDVKADINYPNVLRPGENRGYQTEYRRDDKS